MVDGRRYALVVAGLVEYESGGLLLTKQEIKVEKKVELASADDERDKLIDCLSCYPDREAFEASFSFAIAGHVWGVLAGGWRACSGSDDI